MAEKESNETVLPEGTQVDGLTLIYSQPCDACGGDGICNTLTLESLDGGGGRYWAIETDRWTFDSREELLAILADAERRAKDINDYKKGDTA